MAKPEPVLRQESSQDTVSDEQLQLKTSVQKLAIAEAKPSSNNKFSRRERLLALMEEQ